MYPGGFQNYYGLETTMSSVSFLFEWKCLLAVILCLSHHRMLSMWGRDNLSPLFTGLWIEKNW